MYALYVRMPRFTKLTKNFPLGAGRSRQTLLRTLRQVLEFIERRHFQGVAQQDRPAYSMRFAGPRSQTVHSMTSNSRSSPHLGKKHDNGDPNTLASPSIEESSLS